MVASKLTRKNLPVHRTVKNTGSQTNDSFFNPTQPVRLQHAADDEVVELCKCKKAEKLNLICLCVSSEYDTANNYI